MPDDCRHDLVVRRFDELGAMTTDPATGLTTAPVKRSHYECIECLTHMKVEALDAENAT